MSYSQKIGDLYENAENPIDRILIKILIDLDIWWYTITMMGYAAEAKYRIAKVLAFLKLRRPVDEEFDFPERHWDFD